MYVTIRNVPWKFKHGLIRRCCDFVLSQFCTEELKTQLEIEVVGVKGLHDKEGALGYCSISDEHFGSGKRIPTWFTIELDTNLPFDQLFTVLCHELVHVKQYATLQLREKYHPTYKKLWKDKDITDRYYSHQPHEQEAYRRELKLCNQFFANQLEK
jgi:hypothetical protein